MKLYFSAATTPLARKRFWKLALVPGLISAACFLVMGYYILHRAAPSSEAGSDALETEIADLRAAVENGSASERRHAVLRLVALRAEPALVGLLASPRSAVVQIASAGLWECWLGEEGPEARHRIDEAVERMNEGDLETAAQAFAQLTEEFPGWAEPINKQATVLYLQGKPGPSIDLCRRVLELKPDHFGAWNGLAICAIQIEDWPQALQAVHESLRLQPHSQMNQQLLRLVETRLPQA